MLPYILGIFSNPLSHLTRKSTGNVGMERKPFTRSSSTCKEMVLLTQTFSFNDFHDLQLPTNLFDQAPFFFFARHNSSHFPTRVYTYLLKRHTRSLSPRHLFPLEGWLLYSRSVFSVLFGVHRNDGLPPPPYWSLHGRWNKDDTTKFLRESDTLSFSYSSAHYSN